MYYLLFDSGCMHCSEVARYIQDLGIPELGIRSLRDPQVRDLLVSSGLEGRAQRPLLLRDDDGRHSVQAGIRMRASLFRLLGLRGSMTVVHLARTAQRARGQASDHEVTRRRAMRWVTGGIAAGAVATIFGPRSAMAADRSKASGQDDLAALRAAPAIQTAIATFGAPDWGKTAWYGRGRDGVAAIVHPSSDIVTYASDPRPQRHGHRSNTPRNAYRVTCVAGMVRGQRSPARDANHNPRGDRAHSIAERQDDRNRPRRPGSSANPGQRR